MSIKSTLVQAYAQSQHLWFDPTAEPRYSDIVEIDMGLIRTSLAGPRRPQDRLSPDQVGAAVATWMKERAEAPAGEVPEGAVAIAAITSCTNTSDPRMIIAAGLLARKARNLGLQASSLGQDVFRAGISYRGTLFVARRASR